MKSTEANRPMRVLEKVLGGGLGAGNLGVIVARHGTGKVAVMTAITLDHAMDGKRSLHVAVGKSVSDVRAYDDEVLHELCERLGLTDRGAIQTKVDRHHQIYTFADGRFSAERLRHTLAFLAEYAEFKPELIEIQGWPSFSQIEEADIQALKSTAVEHQCEIWLTAHSHRDDEFDSFGVPVQVGRFAGYISVLMSLEPEADHVPIRFIKVHETPPPEGINLEFDPKSMLIRWR
jgi:hypothetical protein